MTGVVSLPGPPSADAIARATPALAPLRRLIPPKVYGADDVPTEKALLVGNHTLMGVLDVPLLLAELWDRGMMVRRC